MDNEFPDLPHKVGRHDSEMPRLIDLAAYRLLEFYTLDETIAKIRETYTQRPKFSAMEMVKVEKRVLPYISDFCSPLKPKLLPKIRLSSQ